MISSATSTQPQSAQTTDALQNATTALSTQEAVASNVDRIHTAVKALADQTGKTSATNATNGGIEKLGQLIVHLSQLIKDLLSSTLLNNPGTPSTPATPTPAPAPTPTPTTQEPLAPSEEPQPYLPPPSEGQTKPVAQPAQKPGTTAKPKDTKAADSNPDLKGEDLKKTGTFLWKPVAHKDSKLVILLPKGLTGQVRGVTVLSPDGTKTLETGKFSGVANQGREHFRFKKPGAEFPDGAVVMIEMKDGTFKKVTIKETADRTTR